MGILVKASKVSKYKCCCSYNFFRFFHTLFNVPKYGVQLLIFTSNHSLYYRKNVRIVSFYDITLQRNSYFTNIIFIPFKKLVFHRLGLQLYEYEFGIIPIALRSLFTKNISVHNYNTRNGNKLRPAIARYAYRDKVFRFIYVTMLVLMSIFHRLRNLSNVSFYLRNLASNYNAVV